MLEVHHIISRIDKKASGLSSAIPDICKVLSCKSVDVTLHTTHPTPNETIFKVKEYPFWSPLGSLAFSNEMYRNLSAICKEGNLIHNHSLWTFPSLYPGLLSRKYKFPMVFSPHGTLSDWALKRSRWKKKLFWNFGQNYSLKNADCFHATSYSEYQSIRKMGFKQPIAVIPFGVKMDLNILEINKQEEPKILLFFARVHPTKGLELLIKVWSKLYANFPEWELIIAGPEDQPGYQRKLIELSKKLNCKRIRFLGPVYGKQKLDLLSSSSLYVLPTNTENFGITIAEALLARNPAIVTKGAPWEGLNERKCGWWIEKSEAQLYNTLEYAMKLPPDLLGKMGYNGRLWMEQEFSWDEFGEKLVSTYEWILGKGTKSKWIIEK